MSIANNYNSIEERFITNAIYNVQLNSLATPPADVTVDQSLFTSQSFYSESDTAVRIGKFDIRDRVRLKGLGLFCNLADGLVPINNPFDNTTGITGQFRLNRYNAANVQLGIAGPSPFGNVGRFIRFPELNVIYPLDILYSVVNVLTTDDHLRFDVVHTLASSALFATISIDPAYATKRLIFSYVAIVEHSTNLLSAGF